LEVIKFVIGSLGDCGGDGGLLGGVDSGSGSWEAKSRKTSKAGLLLESTLVETALIEASLVETALLLESTLIESSLLEASLIEATLLLEIETSELLLLLLLSVLGI
jgi:hypothetical protein